MSLDGYIATKDDDLSWLSIIEKEGEDYGYSEFTEGIDSYIVGKKTYDVVLGLTGGKFPQSDLFDCYVITRQSLPNENSVTFYNGDLEALIVKLKRKKGKNIYCDGGAQLIKMLMEKDLIDEYIISIVPIILGNGIRLFKGETPEQELKLISSKAFESGMTQLRYARKSQG